jgi:hypothetical protein
VGAAIALSDLPYPRPGSSAQEIRRYFSQSSRAPRVSAAGQLISAASLVAFTRSVAALAGRSGKGSRRLRAAAVAGGGIAAASLATSGVLAAGLTGRLGHDDTGAVAMHRRAFLAGGPTHGVGFGLLVGALGLAGLRTGELPRPLASTGVASAVPNLLSPLYLVAEPAGWFIPAGRFPGLIVSGIAGALLSRPGPRPRRARWRGALV